MPELDYFVVDVFTQTPLAGNPLAVVMHNGLPVNQMQSIAREFNLSETTFVERRPAAVERAEGVRVRIFTTQEELPFAGHPTLGTASVLLRIEPTVAQGNMVILALNVGPIPVRFDTGEGQSGALFGEMTQRDPQFGPELDIHEVERLTGLRADDLDPSYPPQVVSTGTAFAIVTLRSAEPLARLRVNREEATAWLRGMGARWFYVLGPVARDARNTPEYRARMQFNGGEDPATGSAAGCAISYLVARGAVGSDEGILLRQGVEMGRPSELFLSARVESGGVTDVRVAGSTVFVAKGRLFLP
jgi:trans-2,3-dihydro-3-hydroxyanthranilate isomerase